MMGSEAVFGALKRALKSAGLTYREVGQRVGLSESAIKKIFATEDCSVRRLSSLAEVAGLPLSELFAIAERPPFRHVRLSDAQQRWLLEHPEHFAVFWKLGVERLDPAEVRQRMGLEEGAFYKLLARLDDLGLVALGPGDRVRVVHDLLVRWDDEGPLMAALNRTWSRRLVEDALGQAPATFRLHELHCRRETLDDLRQALEHLTDDVVRRARAEQATTPRDGRAVGRLLVAVAPGGFVELG